MPPWLAWLLFLTFGAGFGVTLSVGAFDDIARQLAEHSRLTRGLSTALFVLGVTAVIAGYVSVVTLGLGADVFSSSLLVGGYALWMARRLSRVSFELTAGHTKELLAEQDLREKTIANDRAEMLYEEDLRNSDLAREERLTRIRALQLENERQTLEIYERRRKLEAPAEPADDPDDVDRP